MWNTGSRHFRFSEKSWSRGSALSLEHEQKYIAQRRFLSWMGEGIRAFNAGFRKQRNVESLERLWPDENQTLVA